MLGSLGLIASNWHGGVVVAQLVQVITASPPIGSYFGFLLDVGHERTVATLLEAGNQREGR